jgi:hypothetical protein
MGTWPTLGDERDRLWRRRAYEEDLAAVKSAIRFHIETFRDEELGDETAMIEVFIAEAAISP